MDILSQVLQLDRDFLNIENQKILDAEMEIISRFSKTRNDLITKINSEFLNNTYSVDQKEQIINSLKISSNLIESKIKELQSQIKKEKMSLLNSKKAYNDLSTHNSFFVDRTV